MSNLIEQITIHHLNTVDPTGVGKRLAAAVRAAANRGNIAWHQNVGPVTEMENHFDTGDDRSSSVETIIWSDRGEWSRRAFRFEGQVHLSVDAFGVIEVSATNARVTVISGKTGEATTFVGNGANYALAKIYREVVLRDLGVAAVMPGSYSGCNYPPEFHGWLIGCMADVQKALETEQRQDSPKLFVVESEPKPEPPLDDWEIELMKG